MNTSPPGPSARRTSRSTRASSGTCSIVSNRVTRSMMRSAPEARTRTRPRRSKPSPVAELDELRLHVDADHLAIARERLEHPPGATADVEDRRIAASVRARGRAARRRSGAGRRTRSASARARRTACSRSPPRPLSAAGRGHHLVHEVQVDPRRLEPGQRLEHRAQRRVQPRRALGDEVERTYLPPYGGSAS